MKSSESQAFAPVKLSGHREIQLELFTHRFTSIASEMGEMLQRTAISTNVRERLDFSCALLDAEGRLVVNAPHIPVHLGALGLCVRRLNESVDMRPGDTWVTNHPEYGGSHLPDVTLVSPVHDAAGRLLGYVAGRSHHAEIGGRRPGSMPPDAKCLAEEGVVIPPTLMVRDGKERRAELRRLLGDGPFPSRSPAENMADLDASLAANFRGVRSLQRLAREAGSEAVKRYMGELRAAAGRRMVAALSGLPRGDHDAEERLDDGHVIRVTVSLPAEGRPRFDFTGTGPTHPGNLNATPAIVRSAVLYVLRWLIDDDLPLNEGLLDPVDLVIPEGTFLNPGFGNDPWRAPAVVGGNVETSQRVVDTLLKALGLQACSQGTMNNLLFGNSDFGYYETLCGGTGAGPSHRGTDAVHSHMTNTRITDPEVLEHRYPVRLESFGIRRGSGGRGRHRGGHGVVRELTFLRPAEVSILSQHRTAGPYGIEGGGAGAPGRQRVIHADGTETELRGIDQVDLTPGDRLIVETPGGGGWGEEGSCDSRRAKKKPARA